MLEAIHLNKTNKVLIFSYSMKLLDIIQSIISLKRYKWVFSLLFYLIIKIIIYIINFKVLLD